MDARMTCLMLAELLNNNRLPKQRDSVGEWSKRNGRGVHRVIGAEYANLNRQGRTEEADAVNSAFTNKQGCLAYATEDGPVLHV
jgi:hypothetical protein